MGGVIWELNSGIFSPTSRIPITSRIRINSRIRTPKFLGLFCKRFRLDNLMDDHPPNIFSPSFGPTLMARGSFGAVRLAAARPGAY